MCVCARFNDNDNNKVIGILKNISHGTSLVARWLRIHLPIQETWIRALVWENPTCCGATKPVRDNY